MDLALGLVFITLLVEERSERIQKNAPDNNGSNKKARYSASPVVCVWVIDARGHHLENQDGPTNGQTGKLTIRRMGKVVFFRRMSMLWAGAVIDAVTTHKRGPAGR